MFAAWSMRRAFHEEGESFHAWLTSLVSDEPVEQGAAIDPADMHIEMPEIPIAGLSVEASAELPREVDEETEED